VARIPDSVIDEVNARVSILDVVGESVRLARRGGRYWGLCPFHNEKSPSFTVNPDRNLYHCFGCQESGSSINFLMKNQGLSFPESVRLLAGKLGIEIPEQGEDAGVARKKRKERERYNLASSVARQIYESALWSGVFPEPLEYLESRGVDEATARAFGLGYAPDAWSTLEDRALEKGADVQSLEAAGLLQPRKGGEGFYDRFRHRVMFPIMTVAGQVLAFSGRALSSEERAKYINSPETRFYTKGRELYGLHAAHKAIRERGYAILVEGNFDVVSLHARGFTSTCAPLGTALTEQQARLLKRYCDKVVLMFDADEAGIKAAHKALAMLLAADITDVVWVQLPEGTDPDDIVRKEGATALQVRIDGASPMLEWCLNEVIGPAAGKSDPSAKRRAAEQVVELLRPLRNTLLLQTYMQGAAQRLEMTIELLKGVMRDGARRTYEPAVEPAEDRIEREVAVPLDEHLSVVVCSLATVPSLLSRMYHEEIHLLVPRDDLRLFLERCATQWHEAGGSDMRAELERLPEGGLKHAITTSLVAGRTLSDIDAEKAFNDTVLGLKKRWVRAEQERLSEAQRVAQGRGDFEHELELLERVQELNRYLNELAQPVDAPERE
jgi:DNA primase